MTGLSNRCIIDSLTWLKDEGLISIEKPGSGKKSIYTIHIEETCSLLEEPEENSKSEPSSLEPSKKDLTSELSSPDTFKKDLTSELSSLPLVNSVHRFPESLKKEKENCFVYVADGEEKDNSPSKEKSNTAKGVPVIIVTSSGTRRHEVSELAELIKVDIPNVTPQEIEHAIEQARSKKGKINSIKKYLTQTILNQRAEAIRVKAREKANAKLKSAGAGKPGSAQGNKYYFKACPKTGRQIRVSVLSYGEE